MGCGQALTARQVQVALMLDAGLCAAQVAAKLKISPSTVRSTAAIARRKRAAGASLTAECVGPECFRLLRPPRTRFCSKTCEARYRRVGEGFGVRPLDSLRSSAATKQYLAAFDRLVRARTPREILQTCAAMAHHAGVLGVAPHGPRTVDQAAIELDDRLLPNVAAYAAFRHGQLQPREEGEHHGT